VEKQGPSPYSSLSEGGLFDPFSTMDHGSLMIGREVDTEDSHLGNAIRAIADTKQVVTLVEASEDIEMKEADARIAAS